jgi:hypothetical protein
MFDCTLNGFRFSSQHGSVHSEIRRDLDESQIGGELTVSGHNLWMKVDAYLVSKRHVY